MQYRQLMITLNLPLYWWKAPAIHLFNLQNGQVPSAISLEPMAITHFWAFIIGHSVLDTYAGKQLSKTAADVIKHCRWKNKQLLNVY
jgi:hypothetical protein